jgi:hypothetical protein
MFLTLPLGLLPPPLGIGRCVIQAPRVLLGCILNLARLRKPALEKSNLLSEALCLLTSRGKHRGALCLQPEHPLQGLPLNQGGPILRIHDKSRDAFSRRDGLLGRSLKVA